MDKNLDSFDIQQKIATSYFPLYQTCVNILQGRITILKDKEKLDWFMVFLYISRYCGKELFGYWITQEEPKNKLIFFMILEEAMQIFQVWNFCTQLKFRKIQI